MQLKDDRISGKRVLATPKRNLASVLCTQVGHSLELGDIVLEVNDIPIRSAEDLQALVAMSDKRIVFLVKKTPEQA